MVGVVATLVVVGGGGGRARDVWICEGDKRKGKQPFNCKPTVQIEAGVRVWLPYSNQQYSHLIANQFSKFNNTIVLLPYSNYISMVIQITHGEQANIW
jgi:hypothetical protein